MATLHESIRKIALRERSVSGRKRSSDRVVFQITRRRKEGFHVAKGKTHDANNGPLSVSGALPDRNADEKLQALLSRQASLRNRLHDSQERIDEIQEILSTARDSL